MNLFHQSSYSGHLLPAGGRAGPAFHPGRKEECPALDGARSPRW